MDPVDTPATGVRRTSAESLTVLLDTGARREIA